MGESSTKPTPIQEQMQRDLAAWRATKEAIAKAMRR